MAARALGFAEEQILALDFLRRGFLPIQPTGHWIQLGRGGEVNHVLHLRHMRDQQPVNDVHALFNGADLVAVEIRGTLLEFRKVFHGPETSLRAVDLLVEHAAKADRVQSQPVLLRSRVRIEVELAGGVEIEKNPMPRTGAQRMTT